MDRDPTIVEPLLARVAGRMLAAHGPDPADPRRCRHPHCRRHTYPCAFAALATEAAAQAATELVPAGGVAPGADRSRVGADR